MDKKGKIIIFCPRANATGGTELLHQLGYKLNLFGFDAYMFYYGDDDDQPTIHPHFLKYNVPVAPSLEDSSDNVYVYPEALAGSIEGIKVQLPHSKHILWWLSVDNAHMTPELEKEISEDKSIIHLVQSYYADDYVRDNLSVPDQRRLYLSDYINYNFLNMDNSNKRDNIVLFNPRKGFDRTASIIRSSDHRVKWQAIAGLAPEDVPKLLQTAKVYIDFGNHPGKDRFPREAVSCGCRIITGRRGSAANSRDIPILDQLKVADDTDNGMILLLIYSLLENYEQNEGLYSEYRKMINEEFHSFEADALNVFSGITKREINGDEYDEEALRNIVLDAVSNEDYRRSFYYLTVYRSKGFKIDGDMMVLEAYTRLGLNEEQVALYIMNDLTVADPENYEAYLIKARALIALGKAGVEEALDNAAKYSKGTDDEAYIADAVGMLRS